MAKNSLLFAFLPVAYSNENGLATTPPMGWRSWNLYGANVDQSVIEGIMDGMVSKKRTVDGVPTSLCDLGYCDVGLDDNWQNCDAGTSGNHYHDDISSDNIMLSRVILGSRLMSCRGATCTIAARQEHTLPALPYEYNALAPVVNADIMELHHKKHHATYVNNLNNAEKQLKEATDAGDIGKVIALQPALKFNGGGHINHSIFWTVMSPNGGGEPTGDLLSAINRDFGSYDNMREKLSAASIGIQGSGWGWLGYNKTTRTLAITTCANQDPLEATTGLVPLFGIDVWEHAYYLQYKNVRPDYVKAIFNVANWQNIDERYHNALINS